MILDNNTVKIMLQRDLFNVDKQILIESLLCYNKDRNIFLDNINKGIRTVEMKHRLTDAYKRIKSTLATFNVVSISKVNEFGSLCEIEGTIEQEI